MDSSPPAPSGSTPLTDAQLEDILRGLAQTSVGEDAGVKRTADDDGPGENATMDGRGTTDGPLASNLVMALGACQQRPSLLALAVLKHITAQPIDSLRGEEVSALAGALPSIIRHLFMYDSRGLTLWKSVLEVRDQLVTAVRTGEQPGVAIRAARCLQLLATLFSRPLPVGRPEDEPALSRGDPEEDIELPKGHAFLKGAMLREEAARTVDRLIEALMMRRRSCNGDLVQQQQQQQQLEREDMDRDRDVTTTVEDSTSEGTKSNAYNARWLPLLLAMINLLGRLAGSRPVWLSKIVPALIDLYEAATGAGLEDGVLGSGSGSGSILTHLAHALEKQLEGLMECAAAEKYYPLIVESLKKGKASMAALMAAPGGSGKRRRPSPSPSPSSSSSSATAATTAMGDEEDEDAALAKVGTKRIRTAVTSPMVVASSTTASIGLDVTRVPLALAADVVVHLLRSLDMHQVVRALETWRPEASIVARRDPRRAPPSSASSSQSPLSAAAATAGEAAKTASGTDQMVPFVLGPRRLTEVEALSLHQAQLLRLLQTTEELFAGDRRKDRQRELVRLIHVLPASLVDVLINFCFAALGERLSLLLYCLRLLWTRPDGDNVTDKGEDHGETGPQLQLQPQSSPDLTTSPRLDDSCYGLIYERVLARMQEMVSEQIPQWEVYLQRFLLDVPSLVGEGHLVLLGWLCRQDNAGIRISGLALIEALMGGRPALAPSLTSLLLELATGEDRHATIMVLDRLLPSKRIRPLILTAVREMPLTVDNSDLIIHVVLRTPELLPQIVPAYDLADEAVHQHCLAHVSRFILDKSLAQQLLRETIDVSTPWGVLLERTVDAVCKQGLLSDGEGEVSVRAALERVATGDWPPKLLDRIVVSCISTLAPTPATTAATPAAATTTAPASPSTSSGSDIAIMVPALCSFMRQVDPSREGPAAISLLTKLADKFNGPTMLVTLHEPLSGVDLKRTVDYIQLALTLLRPDQLALALPRLISINPWPPMLLRTFIQALTLHRSALTGLIVGLLARLVAGAVWEQRILWEGFIRCVRTLGASSHALLLQLPEEQLAGLLEAIPEMRPPFLTYLRQQSSAIRIKYGSLLTASMEDDIPVGNLN